MKSLYIYFISVSKFIGRRRHGRASQRNPIPSLSSKLFWFDSRKIFNSLHIHRFIIASSALFVWKKLSQIPLAKTKSPTSRTQRPVANVGKDSVAIVIPPLASSQLLTEQHRNENLHAQGKTHRNNINILNKVSRCTYCYI